MYTFSGRILCALLLWVQDHFAPESLIANLLASLMIASQKTLCEGKGGFLAKANNLIEYNAEGWAIRRQKEIAEHPGLKAKIDEGRRWRRYQQEREEFWNTHPDLPPLPEVIDVSAELALSAQAGLGPVKVSDEEYLKAVMEASEQFLASGGFDEHSSTHECSGLCGYYDCKDVDRARECCELRLVDIHYWGHPGKCLLLPDSIPLQPEELEEMARANGMFEDIRSTKEWNDIFEGIWENMTMEESIDEMESYVTDCPPEFSDPGENEAWKRDIVKRQDRAYKQWLNENFMEDKPAFYGDVETWRKNLISHQEHSFLNRNKMDVSYHSWMAESPLLRGHTKIALVYPFVDRRDRRISIH